MQFDDDGQLTRLAADLAGAGLTAAVKAVPVVSKIAADVEAAGKHYVQALDAVDTGAMMNSISHDTATVSGGTVSAEIGPTVEYAPYVHDGTARMGPRPFMTLAMQANEGPFADAMEALGGDVL